MMMDKIRFFLNGSEKEVQVGPETTVLELLRNNLVLQGIKEGCDFSFINQSSLRRFTLMIDIAFQKEL
jgi:aerobic-type carbon monoxide dehydrogenase small subunit (CoxS/CutS family)